MRYYIVRVPEVILVSSHFRLLASPTKGCNPRPKFMFDSASIFLQTCLQIPNSWALPVPPSMNLMCPPWYFEMYHNRNMRSPQQKGRKAGMQQQNGAGRPGKSGKDGKGFDGDQMGMTQERQREIQASLFKMLGQADDPVMEESKNENVAPPNSKPAASTQPPHHQQQKAPPQQSQAKRSSSTRQVEVVTAIPATPSDEAG